MRDVMVGTMMLLSLVIFSCGPNLEEVGKQFQDAINSGDIDSAVGLIGDDAVVQVDEIRSLTGKEEIESWLETQAELNYRIEGEPVATESGVILDSCTQSSDLWSFLRSNPMAGTCELTLEGGLITAITIEFDQNSKTQWADSLAATDDDLVAIWTAQGVIPRADSAEHPESEDWVTYYLQFDEGGSARLAISLDDLMTPPDSEHPGASLIWTYEDYVLTIQNDGAASEGYCQGQDMGRYMVKNVEDGGIQFKPIEDTCFWRKDAFRRIGSPWDPYVP